MAVGQSSLSKKNSSEFDHNFGIFVPSFSMKVNFKPKVGQKPNRTSLGLGKSTHRLGKADGSTTNDCLLWLH